MGETEADRVLRARARAAAGEGREQLPVEDEAYRDSQLALLAEILSIVPKVLRELRASDYAGAFQRTVYEPRRFGSPKPVQKAAWRLVKHDVPWKDTRVSRAYDLLSDGRVLGPYNDLTRKSLLNDRPPITKLAYSVLKSAHTDLSRTEIPEFTPGVLKKVLTELQKLKGR